MFLMSSKTEGSFSKPEPRSAMRKSGHVGMKFTAGFRGSQRQNLGLPLGGRVFHPKIEIPPTQGIADVSLLVRGEHDETNAPSMNRAQLWNAKLPKTQEFQ
jgi:hypothetical protein